jgi:DNA-binding SARP family transcriptional activator
MSACINGISVVPNAGKPRQVLALLIMRANSVVPFSVISEELWGEAVPRSAATTVQTYILQLRRSIARALPADGARSAKDILVTAFGGYRLAAGLDKFDVRDHAHFVSYGAAALADGNLDTAASALKRAQSLWRGSALADVPVGSVLELEVIGLNEERTRALELRIEADLRLGRHAELIPELRKLAAEFPLNERLAAQLMLAFYRSGQAWRSFEAFRRLRGVLVEELGIEPTPRIQRLHRAMLEADPMLDTADYEENRKPADFRD